jgi:RNA polymerase subunit RPABC4/transcription elongation factor Spt4
MLCNSIGIIRDKANKYFQLGYTKVLLQIILHNGINTCRAHSSVNLAILVWVDDLLIVDPEHSLPRYPVVVKVVALYALHLLVLQSKNSVID